jgi:hypothetical protein
MELQHLQVKLPLAVPEAVEAGEFIPVFHRWIEEQWREELLIDVADYRHVPGGPGVLLIGHQADLAITTTGERPGLCYRRKDTVGGALDERLRRAIRSLLAAALRLESEPGLAGRLGFERGGLEVSVNDRLLAPNCPETFQALRPGLEAFFGGLFGAGTMVAYRNGDPRERFAFTVVPERPFTLEAVLDALG